MVLVRCKSKEGTKDRQTTGLTMLTCCPNFRVLLHILKLNIFARVVAVHILIQESGFTKPIKL
jgi:hypothetical protein